MVSLEFLRVREEYQKYNLEAEMLWFDTVYLNTFKILLYPQRQKCCSTTGKIIVHAQYVVKVGILSILELKHCSSSTPRP
jgi:hypothetical protein